MKLVKWNAPSRWSFCPNSAWGSIETTTIGNTQPTLVCNDLAVGRLLKLVWLGFKVDS